ncbi:hypothetical protein [Bradyrhizobium liaoningense]|uniref:hypothetical protein n=1 Tax=Bradyrhizobium liaoningense TaxID=43992 RepID=UPI001BA5637B|nr:hypothetical protein [Bradyrhizobium liaoningense]MBR0902705.1 hypothetical protein [Bradyrhizobium liaoningense]
MSKQNANPFALIDEPPSLMPADLEAFVEFPGHQSLERASDALRFGYRSKQTGEVFAMLQFPVSTVTRLVPRRAFVRMTIDGKIVVETDMSDDHGALGYSSEGVHLVQLIEEALDVDNLRMEEASPHELNKLLQQLETSMQRVKATLATMHVQGLTASISGSGEDDLGSEVSRYP